MSKEVDGTTGMVDSADEFLSAMAALSPHQQGQCLQVFVLAGILDGHFSGGELKLYRELVEACDNRFACHESYISYCAQQLRNTQPLDYRDLKHCVYWEKDDGAHELTTMYYFSECVHRCFNICTC
jgi:hypothetical protein